MLPAEIPVLIGRQGFPDAQGSMLDASTPIGFYTVAWYGTETDDERGCFAVVNTTGPLAGNIGDYLLVSYKGRDVFVYCIGSQNRLTADIALTRRAFLAISLLAVDPIHAKVSLVTA